MVRDSPPTVTFGSSNLTPYIWHAQPGLSMPSAAIRARGAPGGGCWQSRTVAAAVRVGRVRECPERGESPRRFTRAPVPVPPLRGRLSGG